MTESAPQPAFASRRLSDAFWARAARIAGALRLPRTAPAAPVAPRGEPGISVVIPSRNGRALLEALLPGVARDLTAFHVERASWPATGTSFSPRPGGGTPPLPAERPAPRPQATQRQAAQWAAEIIVSDNGSSDGTAEWLRAAWPDVKVAVSQEPLSFARAVNCGIALARFSRVCLLNNDMLIEPGFFAALMQPFERVPDLFCSTAHIRFPEGVRREETGKAVMADYGPEEFPIRCEEPLAGEDGTWVLYGSGGCSLYDAAKLRALGGVNEAYAPAYVEDMELGWRAWQRGWPSVYVAGAVVEHRHRATTSRYYTGQELDTILEINYLKFLAGNIADRRLFGRLWGRAITRLRLRAAKGNGAACAALRVAAGIALSDARVSDMAPGAEEEFLALTDGSVAVFPGGADLPWGAAGRPSGRRQLLNPPASVADAQTWRSAPLSAGARMEKHISIVTCGSLPACVEARAKDELVLVAGTESWAPPPAGLLERFVEIVLVRGTRESAAFRAAVRQTARRWKADILEGATLK